MRERCSFQRGNAVMEKWLWGAHIAPTHKTAADGCQPLQTTLTPPGQGELDEMPHQTQAPSQGQRFPGQFMTPALLPRMLCRAWFLQNSSCKNVQKWPRESPQPLSHVFPSWMPCVQWQSMKSLLCSQPQWEPLWTQGNFSKITASPRPGAAWYCGAPGLGAATDGLL